MQHGPPGGEIVVMEASAAGAVTGLPLWVYRPDGTPRPLRFNETVHVTDVQLANAAGGAVTLLNGLTNVTGKRILKGTLPIGVIYPNLATPHPLSPGVQPVLISAGAGAVDICMKGFIPNGNSASQQQSWWGSYEKYVFNNMRPDSWFPLNESGGSFAGNMELTDYWTQQATAANAPFANANNFRGANLITKSGGASTFIDGTISGTGWNCSTNFINNAANNPMSWSCWIKTTNLAANASLCSFTDGTVGHYGPRIWIRLNGDVWVSYYDGTTVTSVNFGVGINVVNTIHHIGMKWDGTNITGYWDGRKMGTTPFALTVANWNNVGCIGGASIGGTSVEPFSGNLQDVQVYKRLLSDIDFQNIYSQGTLGI